MLPDVDELVRIEKISIEGFEDTDENVVWKVH